MGKVESGQDAETESKDPYAVLRPSERPPPVLYQGVGPCSRPVRAPIFPLKKRTTARERAPNVQSKYRHSYLYNSYELP